MRQIGNLNVTTTSDLDIVMTRDFNAPRPLVFDAMTKPELLRRWLLGPEGWSMPVCDIDLRVGGRYRYVWRSDADGNEFAMGGVYREIVAPERVVNVERFEGMPGEALCTLELTEQGETTKLKLTMLFDSKEARDGAVASGMEGGVAISYDRLEGILSEFALQETN